MSLERSYIDLQLLPDDSEMGLEQISSGVETINLSDTKTEQEVEREATKNIHAGFANTFFTTSIDYSLEDFLDWLQQPQNPFPMIIEAYRDGDEDLDLESGEMVDILDLCARVCPEDGDEDDLFFAWLHYWNMFPDDEARVLHRARHYVEYRHASRADLLDDIPHWDEAPSRKEQKDKEERKLVREATQELDNMELD